VTGSPLPRAPDGLSEHHHTDMGGTSFDVGIIYGGQPAYSFVSNVAQYEYSAQVDIQAIGSGGGFARTRRSGREDPRVGRSPPGADPGPVCSARAARLPP